MSGTFGDDGTRSTWYTHVRRVPLFLGKTPNGRRIPGGPYTASQLVAGAAALWLLTKATRWLGPSLDIITTGLVVAIGTIVVIFAVGKIPRTAVSPLLYLSGVLSALTGPRSGRIAGAVLRLPRPHIAHTAHIRTLTTSPAQPSTRPTADRTVWSSPVEPPAGTVEAAAPVAAPEVGSAAPLSSIQLALAYGGSVHANHPSTHPVGDDR